MRAVIRDLRDLLISLPFTVALLALSIVLVLAATLDQVNIGIWAVQQKYFHTFAVFLPVGNLSLAVFPGGYLLGGLLLLNLIGSHIYRFKFSWKKSGILLIHAGLILLLLGEFFTSLWQKEFFLRLDEGETKNYAESYRQVEVVITDTSSSDYDSVFAIPERALVTKRPQQHPELPFRVVPRTYLPNAELRMRDPRHPSHGVEEMSADAGFGSQLLATALPVTHRPKERNLPAAAVELVGAEGSLGSWLVSPLLQEPQSFEYAGRTWTIAMRFARQYQPFSLTLLKFTHDRYPGTNIPKNFSSRLRLTSPESQDDREVLVYMNNPLRHGGLTFYQSGFDNSDTTTILQVVRNPSWQMPYLACTMMSLGLAMQFCLHLTRFVRGRGRRPAPSLYPASP
jgi:hypothetical protein